MTNFLRLLSESSKAAPLAEVCACLRDGRPDSRIYTVAPEAFDAVPGKPFAYWVSDEIRENFKRFDRFERNGRFVKHGLTTGDDERFVRAWWEVVSAEQWLPFAKGGNHSPYYVDQSLLLKWLSGGAELRAGYQTKSILGTRLDGCDYFGRLGLTWPLRSRSFSPQVLERGSSFSARGYCAFLPEGTELSALALFNSKAFDYLFKVALGRFGYPEFIVGILQLVPWPLIEDEQSKRLASLAIKAWSLNRTLDTVVEVTHAFLIPQVLRYRLGDYNPAAIEAKISDIQDEIDNIAFDLYGFSEEDRQAALGNIDPASDFEEVSDDEEQKEEAPPLDALLSWAAGVTFGRFDWRLATGEREAPPEPDPFDPLPAKSPGMLPDGAEPYHRHASILVDDQGHKHDLPRLMADVLETVDVQVDEDLRRWLRRDFFKYHLQQYSKSRRKAPIYWPMATASGSYTLWLYYPDLTDQTLFTAVNDFVEPKLKQVDSELANLCAAGANRSREDEKRLEELSDFRDELADLRDTLLEIAPSYKPNHDDGVQITAAPLWRLFRHRPWQNVLKETWEKLEQGDYDWAHLAMAYWPDRVREKCVTDKSLAIAHDLEHLYVEPEPAPKKTRGRKKSTGSSE
ncbi:MAG: hypothetical protein U5L98_16445 [Halomonas sp.]|uniref:hypothetical protein n=1 Tax=Halomonas sp. TaxID=1486246 RepID=UPI002ACE8DB2|nr:hypothetical protein [Halomonas sp.]MDZ7854173.1 hypothetical protein [Halomonas sp.]